MFCRKVQQDLLRWSKSKAEEHVERSPSDHRYGTDSRIDNSISRQSQRSIILAFSLIENLWKLLPQLKIHVKIWRSELISSQVWNPLCRISTTAHRPPTPLINALINLSPTAFGTAEVSYWHSPKRWERRKQNDMILGGFLAWFSGWKLFIYFRLQYRMFILTPSNGRHWRSMA